MFIPVKKIANRRYYKTVFIPLAFTALFITHSFAEEIPALQQKTDTTIVSEKAKETEVKPPEVIDTRINLSGKLGISFGYPYFGVKYGLSQDITAELRGAYNFSDEIYVVSGRGYYSIYRDKSIIGYLGLEGGWTKFNTQGTAGTGYYAMLFGGGEYFFLKNVSLGLDIGPAYIVLGTNYGGIDFSTGGLEWVYNVDLNIYF